jgi:PAS domain S-box-containing protein
LEQRSSDACVVVAAPPGAPSRAQPALARLAGPIRLDVVEDVASCVSRCAAEVVDVLVVEGTAPGPCDGILASLAGEGPPIVVAASGASPEQALEWFRRGAADCVTARADFDEALAVAVLEQVRRGRASRARDESERRIRDLERYTDHILQNMNSALLVVDNDGRVTSSNPPAERILGADPASLRGRPLQDWFPDRENVIARTLAEGVRFRGAESAVTRPDGTLVPIGISCAPIFDSDGRKLGAVATFQDLTEIHQLQRQVLQSEKMASIGQLSAGVAHEINNPMGFIHANLAQMADYVGELRRVWTRVEELQKAVAQGDPGEIERSSGRLSALAEEADVTFLLSDLGKAIRESQEGSERIRHIVHDLRDFSHQETGERVPADVNQALESTTNIVWPMMKHLVVLEKEYEELPAVECFPMQLKQVFMNLLVNAYQAIESRVGSDGESGRIRIHTRRRGDDAVEISVSDTGVGIAAEHLPRIFDPFFTTKGVGAGTGLGLSTSYGIVQRHGGTIAVESASGEGATFRVVLPVEYRGDRGAD